MSEQTPEQYNSENTESERDEGDSMTDNISAVIPVIPIENNEGNQRKDDNENVDSNNTDLLPDYPFYFNHSSGMTLNENCKLPYPNNEREYRSLDVETFNLLHKIYKDIFNSSTHLMECCKTDVERYIKFKRTPYTEDNLRETERMVLANIRQLRD